MSAALLLEPTPAPFPARRRAGVRRSRLVTLLADPGAAPVAVLVAPAGVGKTTLLREWAARDARPFAWITLDAGHDSGSRLLRTVAARVDAAKADAADGRVVLVLDDVHRLRSPSAHDALAAVVHQLPDDVSVALASRTEPPVPVARLRAEGLICELRH